MVSQVTGWDVAVARFLERVYTVSTNVFIRRLGQEIGPSNETTSARRLREGDWSGTTSTFQSKSELTISSNQPTERWWPETPQDPDGAKSPEDLEMELGEFEGDSGPHSNAKFHDLTN